MRLAEGSGAAIMHYVASGSVRLPTGDLPALVSVVVKLLDEAGSGMTVGYVQTAYVTFRILPRLQLVWGRPRNPGERSETDGDAGHEQER